MPRVQGAQASRRTRARDAASVGVGGRASSAGQETTRAHVLRGVSGVRMKRGGPLKRTPFKRKPSRGQPPDRKDDDYLAWLRRQRCRMCNGPGGVAHHPRTGAGIGIKSPDQKAISLCSTCHSQLHALCGLFKDFKRAQLRRWEDRHSEEQRTEYLIQDLKTPSDRF